MKPLHYITALAAAVGLSAGCQNLEEVMIADPSQIVPPVLNSLSTEEISVTNENLGNTVTFAWDEADFGVMAQVNYSVEASYGNSGKVVLFSGINGTSVSLTYETINYMIGLSGELGGLGVPLDTPTDIEYFIGASIGNSREKYYSSPITVKTTVIYAEPIYPTVWVIGKYCLWEHGRSQFLFSFGNDANFEGIIDFGSGYSSHVSEGFKITGAANWENSTGNWGLGQEKPEEEAETITLVNGGGNIQNVYLRRYYSFRYNTSTRVLTKQMSFDRVTCTLNGSEEEMKFNTEKQRFYIDMTLAVGDQMTFSIIDGDQTTVLGSREDEKLDGEASDPITVQTSGNFRIYVDLNCSADRWYRLSAEDYMSGDGPEEPEPGTEPSNSWGIVGSVNNWGNADAEGVITPDFEMSEENGFFVYRNLTLTVSDEFKIRFNNEWDNSKNYGTTDGAAIAPNTEKAVYTAGDSKNIKVTEDGTYDIWFNLSAQVIYIMTAGSPAPEFKSFGIWRENFQEDRDIVMFQKGNYYVAEGVELAEGSGFKIRFSNSWEQNYGVGPVATGEPALIYADGSNMTVSADGTYDIYFEPDYRIIYVMETGAEAPADITWGIVGDITGWGDMSDLSMTRSGDSFLCKNVIFTQAGGFKIRANGAGWGSALGGTYLESNKAFSVTTGTGNIQLAAGTYDIWFNFNRMTVTVVNVKNPGVAENTYGICGSFTSWASDIDMAEEDGAYVCRGLVLGLSDEFKIRVNGSWDNSFGTSGNSVDINTATVLTNQNGTNIKVTQAGTYDIWFFPDTSTLYIMEEGQEPVI